MHLAYFVCYILLVVKLRVIIEYPFEGCWILTRWQQMPIKWR